MLATTARTVPAIAMFMVRPEGRARATPASTARSTPAGRRNSSSPFLPLMRTSRPLTLHSTPSGMLTGAFATLDMISFLFSLAACLRYFAQHFTTVAGGTRRTIGHHALRGGNNGNTQAADDLRYVLLAAID